MKKIVIYCGKIRLLTEITNENIHYCKNLMKIVDEFRHLDGIKGGIAVNEREYMATTILEEAQSLTQVIYSNFKEVVEQGQYVFDMLWNRAIPAKQRIKEIEEGAKREFIETIQDPVETEKLASNLIKSSTEEILILFSTANSLYCQEHNGILQLLREAAQRGVKIRILVNKADLIKLIKQKLKKQQQQELIDIRYFSKTITKITTLVVDRAFSLSIEVKEDTKETFNEATGLATYSNSE